MQTFLEEVVEDLLNSSQALDQLCFVLPSKRAGTFLKKHLATRIHQTIFLPEILSIEELLQKIVPLPAATNTVLIFELYEAYLQLDQIKEKDSFSVFSKWAQTLLQDFNEIDRYLIDAQQIFGDLTAIQKLNHWNLNGTTPMIQDYITFSNTLFPLYDQYKKRLLEKKLGYQGMIYRAAATEIETYCTTNTKQHIFIGFNALNKAEEIILQTLLTHQQASVYWDIDNYFINDPIHKASHFIKTYKNWTYHQQNPIATTSLYNTSKNINIIGVPKQSSQAQYVSHILTHDLKDTQKDTAVILGDEKLLNPVLNSLPSTINSINITMGYPLNKSNVASLFYHLFELYIKQTAEGWYYKNVIAILSHPIVQKLLQQHTKNAHYYIKNIHHKNWIYLNPQQTSELLKGIDVSLLTLFDAHSNINQRLEELLDLILNLKNSLDPQHKDEALQLEYLYKIHQLFNQLILLNTTYPHLKTYQDAFHIFKELMSMETLDFEGEPLSGLQLMGMLESRNLDFENIIITGLNEGILPAGKSNNSFLPFDVKIAYQLPTYADKDAVYTYHFYRLLQRAKNVYLLYNTEPDVLEGRERSRFITQLLTDSAPNHNINTIIASPLVQTTTTTLRSVKKDEDLILQLVNKAQRGFSPSALTNYIRNPLDFFKQTVLGIQSYDLLQETVAINTFGTIVHDSLEKLYTPFIGQELETKALKEIVKDIPKTVKYYFKTHYQESDITSGKNVLIIQVAIKYIQLFIQAEIKSLATNTIKLIALEQNLQHQITIAGFKHPVKLRGIVDRIDEFNGVFRITDYKTGRVIASQLEILDWNNLIEDYKYSKAFQVLFYAFLYTKGSIDKPITAGIFSFKNAKSGFLGFAKKEKARGPKDYLISQKVLEEFKNQLEILLVEIFNTSIPLTEKEV